MNSDSIFGVNGPPDGPVREESLRKAYDTVKGSYEEMIFRMALLAEHKDEDTGTHLIRIVDYSTEIARGMGLDADNVEIIRYASPMHDIGKLLIPDNILKKKDSLTPEEREIMQKHAELGADIFMGSRSPLLMAACEICLTHHERYDGTGYPNGLKGDQIPVFGRIVALADVFDALTSIRPYKRAMDIRDAMDVIATQSGSHFDPKVLSAFKQRADSIRKIWQATKDIEGLVR
ncbi:MAG: HD domain-containing protein [Candidatus Omnitrophica bacterium]|nr:HD domain-containing protein [Candidatus Omnitrophota bacterium]MDD5487501.1 HD domain-containing protein [Candidatus Omnitrophota bacterium]